MSESEIISELRSLIVRAAPDPDDAAPVVSCSADRPLDEVIPFSSLIVLGTVVAVEDRFAIEVTHEALQRATASSVTLRTLAAMVAELVARSQPPCTS